MASALFANLPVSAATSLYDQAVAVLRTRYFDQTFRETKLPELAARYRADALAAKDLNAQRDALSQLLSHIPASHLGVLSEESFNYLVGELTGVQRPTFGFHALRLGREYFTALVLEGGPAAEAGIVPWERIVSVDREPIAQSARLDYEQKDAYLSIERDPPIHSLLCEKDDAATFLLERKSGERRSVKLQARPYSALEGARASARTIEMDGRTIGYVHFWFIHSSGVLELLRELFDGPFAKAEGLLLDLRGRGGNGVIVNPMLELLREWGRPIVALTDRQSRSAKDALAYEFKRRRLALLVGERTAGAVIPATFAPLSDKTVLMFPSFTLGEYTEQLELKGGVEPDIQVERAGPYSAGDDPILFRGARELVRLAGEAKPSASPISAVTEVSSPTPLSTKSTSELPTIDTLLKKMVDSLGGEQALRAHQHRTLSGTTEMVGLPMKGAFLQKAAAPDRSIVVMNLGDLSIKQGFDGTTAWTRTSMNGLQILQGAMADAVKQQAKFYGPLDLVAGNKEVTPTGFVSFDGRNCIELKVIGPSGGLSWLYVDGATFLIAGTKATIETPIGAIESKTYLRAYQTLQGFTTPTEIFVESNVQRQVIRIDVINFDPIPPEDFAVPGSTR